MAKGKELAPTNKNAAIMSYEEEMAQYAKEVAEQVKPPSSGSISFKGGLHIDGQRMEGDKANVIVVDFCYENNFYVGKYDPEDVKSPVCYAYGRHEEEMRPHPSCESPQAEACAGCPQNAWGTSNQGKGKACQNRRRLMVISADYDDLEGIKEAPLKRTKVPVTSAKNWDGYATGLTRQLTGPRFVITELSVITGGKNMVEVKFRNQGLVPPELMPGVKEKLAEAQDLLMAEYPKNEEKPEAAPSKGKAKFAGKK